MVDPDDRARVALPAEASTPASTATPRLDGGRQHGLLVVVVLLLEELPARHRDDAHVGLERLGRLERQVHLAAGRDHDRLGLALAALPQRVGAAQGAARRRRPRSGRRSAASAASARARRGRPAARARSARPSPSRSRRRAARTRGSGSPAAPCGARPAGASGRPRRRRSSRASRPRPCCRPIRAERRTAGAHVVGEDQERRAVRARASPARARSRSRSSPSRARGSRRRCCGRRASAEKTPAPSNSVLSTRRGRPTPPTIVGVNGFRACITLRAGVARRDLLAGREHGQRLAPALARLAAQVELALPRELRERCRPRRRGGPPTRAAARRRARRTTAMCSRTASETANVASGSKPIDLLRRADLGLAERGAVRLRRVDRVRRRIGDVAAQDDQRRPLLLGLRRRERAEERVEILGVVDVLDVPAVGLEALALVLGRERERRRAVDRDVVVVVDVDEAAEPEVAGDRRRLLS